MIKKFRHYFFGIIDKKDKKNFGIYIVVLLSGSIFSILGISTVIPFIYILIQPEKIMALLPFQCWSYQQLILLFTALFISAFLLKNLIAFALLNYQSHFLYGLVAKIQSKLFTGYMTLPYEYHLYRNTPSLIKNINTEVAIYFNSITSSFGIFLTESITIFFILIVMIIISPAITLLISFAIFISLFYLVRIIKQKIEYYSELRNRAALSVNNTIISGLSGIKESKLYACEDYFIKEFNKSTIELKYSSCYQGTLQQTPRMLIEFVGLTVIMMVLCVFTVLGNNPEEMFGLLSAFSVATVQLLPSLNRLTRAVVQIKYGMPALKIVYNELKQINNTSLKAPVIKNQKLIKKFHKKIVLKDLHYVYKDGTIALKNVNVNLLKNKRIAFIGASGAGKTTLVDLLMGLYAPTKGHIVVDGKTLETKADIFSFQRLFAYIPQKVVLYNKSVQENIAFGVPKEKIDHQKIDLCLKVVQLETCFQSFEKKENKLIGESGIRLSGGQRQKIGIARALYHNSKILIMDETTSALDRKTEKEMVNMLSSLKNLTIITVAHHLSTIKYYDIIYILDQGKIIAAGNYNELLKNCSQFKKMISI